MFTARAQKKILMLKLQKVSDKQEEYDKTAVRVSTEGPAQQQTVYLMKVQISMYQYH